jgi:hypothetical protein
MKIRTAAGLMGVMLSLVLGAAAPPAPTDLVLTNGHIFAPPGWVDSLVEHSGIASCPARAVTGLRRTGYA